MRTGSTPGDCGLKPRSVHLDADALRGAEGASPFSLRSVVESAQVLGLFVRDWCGLVPGRKEES